jgi:FtsZ-interacting cell division protein ZipA
MPQLRLILLGMGLVFLIGLAWWEMRRPHQARGSELPRPTPEPLEPPTERAAEWDSAPLELPRMSARSPELDLPVVEVEAEDFAALAAQAEGAPQQAAPAGGVEGLLDELGAQQCSDPPISDITATFETIETPAAETFAAEAADSSAAEPVPAAAAPVSQSSAGAVVVDWPAAAASQVLAVRVISSGEKFSGRAVRMALAAEGFELGKFQIFHKPAPDGRALLSIASLNKPGTFDRQSIDLQRYSGLNLFTVLPGPVPGPDAVDEMLMCAQVLSQRLRGTLQDERGQPLTPSRTAVMRDVAAAAAP